MCDTLSLAKALYFAIGHDAQVINLSLSGPPDPLLGRLIDAALSRGMVVVGALDPNAADGGFPADHPGVVAVSDDPAITIPGALVAPGREARSSKLIAEYGSPQRKTTTMKQDISVDLSGGKRISFETGRLAKQAHGSTVVRIGDNVVIATEP